MENKRFCDLNLFKENKLFVFYKSEVTEETIIGLKIQRIGLEGTLVFDITTKEGWNYPIIIEKIENDIYNFEETKDGKMYISTSMDRLLLETTEEIK